MSTDAEEGFKEALSAFQASEAFLRDWGMSLLGGSAGDSSHHGTPTDAGADHHHQHHQQQPEHLRQQGAAALRRVVQQLQQILPAQAHGNGHGQHGSATALPGCSAAPSSSGSQSPVNDIQQSLHCLEHLIAALDAGQEGGQDTVSAGTPEGGTGKQPDSAGSLVSRAWHELTGRGDHNHLQAEVVDRASGAAHAAGDAAADAAQAAKSTMHNAADETARAAASTRHAAAHAADNTANTADKAAAAAGNRVKEAAHRVHETVSALPDAAKHAAGEASGQVVYTAGFLTEVAKDAAGRVLQPVVKAGEAAAGAAQHVAGSLSHAESAAQQAATDTLHGVQDAAGDAAGAAKDAGSAAAHTLHETGSAVKHRAAGAAEHAAASGAHMAGGVLDSGADALQTGADTAHGAAGKLDSKAVQHHASAWSGAQHTLHDRLVHVKSILRAARKLPSLRPGSVISRLQRQDGGGSDADTDPRQAHDVMQMRGLYIEALHEGVESLQVGSWGAGLYWSCGDAERLHPPCMNCSLDPGGSCDQCQVGLPTATC